MRTRLERAIDRRDDIQHKINADACIWKPSTRRKWERKLEAAEQKVQLLGGYECE